MQKTKYNSNFEGAVWNKQRQLYEITFSRTTDKDVKFQVEVEVLISAIGGFSTPLDAPPSLPGLLDFKGERASLYSIRSRAFGLNERRLPLCAMESPSRPSQQDGRRHRQRLFWRSVHSRHRGRGHDQDHQLLAHPVMVLPECVVFCLERIAMSSDVAQEISERTAA